MAVTQLPCIFQESLSFQHCFLHAFWFQLVKITFAKELWDAILDTVLGGCHLSTAKGRSNKRKGALTALEVCVSQHFSEFLPQHWTWSKGFASAVFSIRAKKKGKHLERLNKSLVRLNTSLERLNTSLERLHTQHWRGFNQPSGLWTAKASARERFPHHQNIQQSHQLPSCKGCKQVWKKKLVAQQPGGSSCQRAEAQRIWPQCTSSQSHWLVWWHCAHLQMHSKNVVESN